MHLVVGPPYMHTTVNSQLDPNTNASSTETKAMKAVPLT
jgi:hypothetical protein